jgi:Protein of unknown function (DUF2914)
MSDKKNIVIKVKYLSPGKASDKTDVRSGMVSEWNFKRIGLVLGSLLLVFMALFYFTDSDDQQVNTADNSNKQLSLPVPPVETKTQLDKVINAPEQPKIDIDKVIVRAQLTHDIEKNEPVDKLKIPLKIGKNETLWIYYFVELKGMEGKAVYHEWWLNGNLVSRKKVNISDDPWRTASKQLITYTTNNDWIVRVVDDSRNKLTETNFNLELK